MGRQLTDGEERDLVAAAAGCLYHSAAADQLLQVPDTANHLSR
jgi:hypothetical protein